jgi:hypothetical protein
MIPGTRSKSASLLARCLFLPIVDNTARSMLMESRAERLGATHLGECLVVLFIPSVDREETAIDQEVWVTASLKMLGTYFRGGTAFPQGRGVWRDDARGGRLVFDEPTVVQCYTEEEALVDLHLEVLRDFLVQMGRATNQGAVGIVIDREYYEITLGDLP